MNQRDMALSGLVDPQGRDDLAGDIRTVAGELEVLGKALFGVRSDLEETAAPRGGFSASRYSLIALCCLAPIEGIARTVFPFLGIDITASLGSGGSFALAIGLVPFLLVAGSFLVLAFVIHGRLRDRARASVLASALGSLAILFAGLISNGVELAVGVLGGAVAVGCLQAVDRPLLIDMFPASRRVRVAALFCATIALGAALASVGVGLMSGGLNFSWRAILLVLGCASLVASLIAIKLKDPGSGRSDTSRLEELTRRAAGLDAGDASAPLGTSGDGASSNPGWIVTQRRILSNSSARGALAFFFVFGTFSGPIQSLVVTLLHERWLLSTAVQASDVGLLNLAAVPPLIWLAVRGHRACDGDVGQLSRRISYFAILGLAATFGAAFLPVFGLMFALLIVGFGSLYLVLPVAIVMLMMVTDARVRTHAAVLGAAGIAFGAFQGSIVSSAFETRFGIPTAFGAVCILGLALVRPVLKRSKDVEPDVGSLVRATVEREDLRVRIAKGQHLPLLACHHLDYSYGPVQVLFDVDLEIDDGEMVALLGTNGAGKSTLLRAISGLGSPSRGTIHFRGSDITHLEPPRRVELGICQLPGGKGVFGPLTVAENLRAYGATSRRGSRAVERGMERAFEAFPVLAERRNQLASTLSGGQQQMLTLSAAMIANPRLILIDELSLGLAPIVVERLLEMIRELNAQGTAIVLVEQSVNVALTLVNHAYFMERGEIRFDGTAKALLERPDLLRAAFLGGTLEAMGIHELEGRIAVAHQDVSQS